MRLRPPDPRGDRIAGRRVDLLHGPVDLVAQLDGIPRLRKRFGHPERRDVVVRLVVGVQLEQPDAALGPPADGLDPGAGTQVVEGLEVLVVLELPGALDQSEPPWVLVREGRDPGRVGIGERPPYPLPRPGVYHQAVGIVHLGPEVVVARVGVFPVPEHARQRREPEGRRVAPAVQAPVALGPSRSAYTTRAFESGSGRSTQNSRNTGNSSPPGSPVLIARPRADRPYTARWQTNRK